MKFVRFLIITACCAFPLWSYGSEIVTQTGVATPQSNAEEGNVEKLRERAIRSAMDLAVLQVSGALLSGERGDTLRSREDTTIRNDEVSEQTVQQGRFHRSVTSRTTGQVRLVEIVREWHEGNQYYVEAKVEVGTPNEAQKEMTAGFFWERVGKPTVALTLTEKENDQEVDAGKENRTFRFLRDNLVRNGVTPAKENTQTPGYLIKVAQDFQITPLEELSSYTIHCQLSFQVSDTLRNETVAEHRASNGPKAGFSVDQGKTSCIQEIAGDFSEQLIRDFARVMNELWNNGIEYKVLIDSFPEDAVTQANDIFTNLFKSGTIREFSYGEKKLSVSLHYKGNGADLAEAIKQSFEELDWKIVPEAIQNNRIELHWISQTQ